MNVLLALDLSEDPRDLVRRAVPWASAFDARLSLAAVLELRLASDTLFGPAEAAAQAVKLVEIQDAARDHLAELLGREVPPPIRGRMVLRLGDPAQALCELALEDVDLVVVGSHRRRGLKRLFLGSVAERVVRRAAVPVLVLSLDGPSLQPGEDLCAVVPIDAAEPDGAAVAWLRRRLPHLALLPMYALPWTPAVEGVELVSAVGDSDLAVWARGRLDEVLATLGHGGEEPTLVPRHGESAGDAIAAFAEERDADLIALPTHGPRGLGQWALGSVAERLVRASHRPVLVVR